jgi:hypothetical protein
MENKIWSANEIRENLQTKDLWVYRGLMTLYERQTKQEKRVGDAVENNHMGFSGGGEAEFGTAMAETYKKFRHLTPKQMLATRKIVLRHVNQLTKIANHKL